MRVVIDTEANSLSRPSKVWLIVCKDIDSGEYHIFRNLSENADDKERFTSFAKEVTLWIGHNFLEYDYPVLNRLCNLNVDDVGAVSLDTLIVSRLANYHRKKHSIESYGIEFGLEKVGFNDFTKYSREMEEYCIRDVDICYRIYLKYLKYISKKEHKYAITLEHRFQLVANSLSNNGFCFNTKKANGLLTKVTKELGIIDSKIQEEFTPKEVIVRTFVPKATKYNTISKTSVPRSLWSNIHEYEIGKEYPVVKTQEFNAASHKQVIEVLVEAGWSPIEKTKTHIETEREITRLKNSKLTKDQLDIEKKRLYDKLDHLKKYGWSINENNLTTLPDTAPSPARLLAKRILLESRRRTLTEWLGLVDPVTDRIHGKFQGIGAWTHRMAHQKPNTANIPNEFDTENKVKLLGKEMRQLWRAPRNRLLVGVDADAIQLRVFAHLINDAEFTQALINGRKGDKTDAHSLNQRILGPVCKTRAGAKRFIYALLLGAGKWKLASILDCSEQQVEQALQRLLERYEGWAELKSNEIQRDARRGWFTGLDGRSVAIPGDSESERRHLCMSGYLQNGEAVIMKAATLKWLPRVEALNKEHENLLAMLVDLVHDEWQTETNNNVEFALKIASIQADSLREVGEEFQLRCPLAGSFYNEDHRDYTIGTDWYQTH